MSTLPSAIPLIGEPNLLSLVYAFIGGVLSSLTPCVYPVIPITLQLWVRGARSRGVMRSSRARSMLVGWSQPIRCSA